MKKYQNERELIKSGHDIIFKKIQASLLLLANNKIELKSTYSTIGNYAIPKDLKDLENYLSKNLSDLDKYFILSADEKLLFIQDMVTKKRNLEYISKSIQLYAYEAENIEVLLHYYFIKLNAEMEIKELSFIENIDNDALIEQCSSFIESSKEMSPTLRASILSCFPLYLTKEKYADFITQNLLKIFKENNNELFHEVTTNLMRRFSPTKTTDYGKYFSEIEKRLSKALKSLKNNLKLDDIESLNEEIYNLKNDIDEINYYTEILLECFNYFIIILNFADNVDEFFVDNNVYKDLFYVVKENSTNDDLEFYDDTIKESIQDCCETLLDDITSLENNFNKIMDSIKSKSLPLEELESITNTINFFFHEELESIIYTVYTEDVASLNLYEIIEKFKEYIKTSLSHLPNKIQKIIKQSFFSKIPCEYSQDIIYNYLSNSLKNTSNYLEKAIIVYEVNELFDSYNFNTKSEHQSEHNCCKDHVHSIHCNHD